MQAEISYLTVTIGASESLSADVFLPQGSQIVGIRTPSAWTAADLGFQIADDKIRRPDDTDATPTSYTIAHRTSDDAYLGLPTAQIPTAAAKWHAVDVVAEYAMLRRFKLFSHNGSGVATAQTAARTITLAYRVIV